MLAITLLAVAVVVPTSAGAKSAKAKNLVGTFAIVAGDAAGTGSYFRMVQPNGTVDAGPFVTNGDSTADDQTYTPLTPGTDDGLVTGEFQPQPEPPFDAAGNGTASAIVQPAKFFGVAFAVATNETDPQTGEATTAPKIKVKKGALSGNLAAVGVAYGEQHFNQGSPKPDGTKPTGTSGPSGTYDTKTKTFVARVVERHRRRAVQRLHRHLAPRGNVRAREVVVTTTSERATSCLTSATSSASRIR